MGAALTWVRYKAVRAEGAGGSRARVFGGGLRHGGGGSGFRIRLTTGPVRRRSPWGSDMNKGLTFSNMMGEKG